MDVVLQLQLDFIIAVQRVRGPLVDAVWCGITQLGGGLFLTLCLCFIIWCLDYRQGLRIMVLLYLSSWCNFLLKDIVAQPRPFQFNGDLGIITSRGYGFPSNHAQSSLVMWGAIAVWVQKRWVKAVCLTTALMVGCSRIYLGVHFPTDVLGGWVVGGIFLGAIPLVLPRAEAWLQDGGLLRQVVAAVAVPLALLIAHPTVIAARTLGVLAGTGTGAALAVRFLSFSGGGPWLHRSLRFIVGSAGFVLLFGLLSRVPGLRAESGGGTGAFFLLFAVVGLWISYGAPCLFCFLKIGCRDEDKRLPAQ